MDDMNTLLCGQCAHFDPILARGGKTTRRGWCVKRSIYPHSPGPGQVFPTGAVRATDVSALAEPFIVKLDSVVESCADAQRAKTNVIDQKQMRTQTRTQTRT